jgi:hypothetical protein
MHLKARHRLEQRLAQAEQLVSARELLPKEQRTTSEERLRDGLDAEHADNEGRDAH